LGVPDGDEVCADALVRVIAMANDGWPHRMQQIAYASSFGIRVRAPRGRTRSAQGGTRRCCSPYPAPWEA